MIVLEDAETPLIPQLVARRLLAATHPAIHTLDGDMRINLSIGIAFSPAPAPMPTS